MLFPVSEARTVRTLRPGHQGREGDSLEGPGKRTAAADQAAGKVSTKVAPMSTVVSSSMRPSWSSMMK